MLDAWRGRETGEIADNGLSLRVAAVPAGGIGPRRMVCEGP